MHFIFRLYMPFFILYLVSKSKLLEKNPKSFMKNNFIIYCTHFQLAVVIKRLFMIIFGTNEWLLLVYQLVTCFMVVCIINIFIKLGKKICPKFIMFISGGRV